MSVELAVVVDDTTEDASLTTEHGLAVHVAVGGRRFLFDSAASSRTLSANAAALGIDLANVEAVVISHGHRGHTGGTPALVRARPGVHVHAHPEVFAKRYRQRPDQPRRQIGWRSSPEALAEQGMKFCPVRAPQMLTDELMLSGPIAGPQPLAGTYLVQALEATVPDEFEDELFLMIRGSSGWVVLTGCCHRGLANTLRAARDLARGEPIAAVLGGFHLAAAGPDDLAAAADAIKQVKPQAVYPCHCTGQAGSEYLARRFPGLVRQVHAGSRLTF